MIATLRSLLTGTIAHARDANPCRGVIPSVKSTKPAASATRIRQDAPRARGGAARGYWWRFGPAKCSRMPPRRGRHRATRGGSSDRGRAIRQVRPCVAGRLRADRPGRRCRPAGQKLAGLAGLSGLHRATAAVAGERCRACCGAPTSTRRPSRTCARRSLRLRKCSARTPCESDGEVVWLNAAAIQCDVSRFEALIREGSRDALSCGGRSLPGPADRRRCRQRRGLERMADGRTRAVARTRPWRAWWGSANRSLPPAAPNMP